MKGAGPPYLSVFIFSLGVIACQPVPPQRSTAMEPVQQAPDTSSIAQHPDHELIRYGRQLITHTQQYFGPSGKVRPNSINQLNCQNCHLDAGTRPYGNNYFGVASTYPLFRPRSGTLETIPRRVNDCFQRSLNGQPIDTAGREMQAIVAYMIWLGNGVPKGEKPKGSGLLELPFLDRPADPDKGALVFREKCAVCHGSDGHGLPIAGADGRYPPLWGDQSYNQGAGLYRLSRFAAYVKSNMPFGATYKTPLLSDEEAWDVSAFVNSQPRPNHPLLEHDWPNIRQKPADHPFGPFADSFPESQHKYGPYGPITAYYQSLQKQ